MEGERNNPVEAWPSPDLGACAWDGKRKSESAARLVYGRVGGRGRGRGQKAGQKRSPPPGCPASSSAGASKNKRGAGAAIVIGILSPLPTTFCRTPEAPHLRCTHCERKCSVACVRCKGGSGAGGGAAPLIGQGHQPRPPHITLLLLLSDQVAASLLTPPPPNTLQHRRGHRETSQARRGATRGPAFVLIKRRRRPEAPAIMVRAQKRCGRGNARPGHPPTCLPCIKTATLSAAPHCMNITP